MPIDLDLTHFVKETQLQHGLRSEDYERYHRYITNRLATLRKQVNLCNDRKKFLHKDVTAANATDPRHVMLLVLYAERCWAEAESIVEKRQTLKSVPRGEANKPKGGVPPQDQSGKRLNKSVKWAEKLRTVAQAVGTERLKQECAAYYAETYGRMAALHGRYAEAKKSFADARELYHKLRHTSSDAQWSMVLLKMNELDDRVVYCMQQLGEDPQSYKPPAVHHGKKDSDELTSAALTWNGRSLSVFNMKVKDALREARGIPVEPAQAKLLENAGLIAVGQSNKVLDLMDRRINLLNDALSHARQDLRGAMEGSNGKVERQLLVHCLLFRVNEETLRRALFLADVLSRRFRATERVLQHHSDASRQRGRAVPARKSEVSPAQFVSPLEVVRLYEVAADAVEQMELLPGVSGREDVEEMSATAQSGRLLYTGEGWRVVGDTVRAEQCYQAALKLMKAVPASTPEAQRMLDLAERAVLVGSARNVLSSSTSAAVRGEAPPAESALVYLTDAAADEVAVARNVVRFPPDYQATVCKPTFVDVASTFLEFPVEGDDEEQESPSQQPTHHKESASAKAAKAGGSAGKSGAGNDKKKWGWKWGWGS